VYDLTDLIRENMGPLAKPLIRMAGEDISYLFDPQTGDPKTWIEPVTNLKQYYLPCGRFLHVPPTYPHSAWKGTFGLPWWRDPQLRMGQLTSKTRKIVIVNTLTKQEDVMTVCSEETVEEIRNRYVEYNAHAGSYTFKKLERGG
jgi:hypothetical protein